MGDRWPGWVNALIVLVATAIITAGICLAAVTTVD